MQIILLQIINEKEKKIKKLNTRDQELKEQKEKIIDSLTENRILQEIKETKINMQNKKSTKIFNFFQSKKETQEKIKVVDIKEQEKTQDVQKKQFELQLIDEKLSNLPQEIAQLEEDLEKLKQSLKSKSNEKILFCFMCLIFNITLYFCIPAILKLFPTAPVITRVCFYVYDKVKNCYHYCYSTIRLNNFTCIVLHASALFIQVWVNVRQNK